MNDGARILLMDAEGNVSGGDRSADPRGGIFGAQGYGGGLFDGSTGLGAVGDTAGCAATCAALMLLPVTGPTLAAFCLDKCAEGEKSPPGCSVPGECVDAAARFPAELPPKLVTDYCGFPFEVQQTIAKACYSLAALPPGTKMPPAEPPPPVMPGDIDPTKPKDPTFKADTGMDLGTVALIAGGVLVVGWALLAKKGKR